MPSWAYINHKLKTEKARELQVSNRASHISKNDNDVLDVANFPNELELTYFVTLYNTDGVSEYDNGLKCRHYESRDSVEYDYIDDVLFMDYVFVDIYNDGTVEVESDHENLHRRNEAHSFSQARDIAEDLFDDVMNILSR